MPEPSIDRATLQALQDSAGTDFVAELVATFLDEAPVMLAELRGALAAGDAAGYRRAAHSLKSNGLTFGALALAALARDCELRGLAPPPADNAAALAALQAEYERAAVALRAICHA